MAEVIRMPKMSDTMTEGVISSWQKKVGDNVKSGDILAEVETDKATMELESYDDGILLYKAVEEKESVAINGIIAIIGKEGENIDNLLANIKAKGKFAENKKEEIIVSTPANKEAVIDVSDINATIVRMPKMSDTMTEGTISSWLMKVGDTVKSGDILAEVDTDKATMELESYDDGILLYKAVEAGKSVAINEIIAIIGEKDTDIDMLLKAYSSEQTEKKPVEKHQNSSVPQPVAVTDKPTQITVPVSNTNDRVIASPLAKKLAQEKGFDISQITGSGDGGRIIKRDVEVFIPSAQPIPTQESSAINLITLPTVASEESYEEIPVSQMRKVIANRLSESKFNSPHFYLTIEINMDKAIEARKSINEISPVKISFNDIIIKAVATSLRQHPNVNLSWLGDKIRKNHHIHIGVAIALEEGLLVPVIKFADNKSLSHISTEVKNLSIKARNKKLQPSDWEGNTFTISNLGMFGIEEFTAIINPPDACILAIGGIKQIPIVKNGEIIPGNIMKVTMSCDHRVVDGAVGSAFLKTLKELLEDPVKILI